MTKRADPLEVARYYLKSELGYALPKLGRVNDFEEIDHKNPDEIMSLCEALSIHYRRNAVWWIVADDSFGWTQEEVPINKIKMTGMGDDTAITKLIYSPEVKGNPIILKKILENYYAKNPSGPDKYGVRPTNASIKLSKVLLVEHKGELRLLDGSHRFIEQLLDNQPTVNAFVARPKEGLSKIKPFVGEGTFRTLLRAYRNATAEEKTDIYKVAEILSKNSSLDNPLRIFEDSAIQKEALVNG